MKNKIGYIIWAVFFSGCSMFFNPDNYNPNPKPIIAEEQEEIIRVDTIRLTNGIDHIIILDTLKSE